MTERYVDALGVQEHMRLGAGAGRSSQLRSFAEHGASRNPTAFGSTPRGRRRPVQDAQERHHAQSDVVPASKEKELDALFASHERFMRSTTRTAMQSVHDDLNNLG